MKGNDKFISLFLLLNLKEYRFYPKVLTQRTQLTSKEQPLSY
jgi:hypothetical protein